MFNIEVHKADTAIVGKSADCGVRTSSMASMPRNKFESCHIKRTQLTR
jgi:hypothetical protein